jgi:translation initiation factor 2B subunit (eIF-2B alpha/beta/delta family)
MTQQEFIDATNLAKVRSALAVLREIITQDKGTITTKGYSRAVRSVAALDEKLSKKVKTKG